MSQHIRDRIQRKLGALSEDRLYQVLDFVEFLELKYPAAQPAAPANPLQRFADGIEDRLRNGGVSAVRVAEAMGLLNRAVGVLGGVAAAGLANSVTTGLRTARHMRGLWPWAMAGATFLAVGLLRWPMIPVVAVLIPASIGLAWLDGRARG